jgi:hypothetical protein
VDIYGAGDRYQGGFRNVRFPALRLARWGIVRHHPGRVEITPEPPDPVLPPGTMA